MRKIFNPFMILFTIFVGSAYAYARYQLSPNLFWDLLLALPFLSIWLTPILFWIGDIAESKPWSHLFQEFAYLSMGWLNFVFVCLIPLNVADLLLRAIGETIRADHLDQLTTPLTLIGSFLALALGYLRAKKGPRVREVDIPLSKSLLKHSSPLNGLKLVQISDLHVGPTIQRPYVERVVEKANAAEGDLIVLTGDIVDGSLNKLREHAAPLAHLRARFGVFLILGNHDYYSGAAAWVQEFKAMGIKVLLNTHQRIQKDGEEFMLAGVLDPAVQGFSAEQKPDPFLARGNIADSEDLLRILLAHNPKLAGEAARAGYHLQISGHTHAGQFIPWTWITKLVHKPHYVGLSREASMVVYVSPGTGSWGPPIRFGTSPELSVLTLRSADV